MNKEQIKRAKYVMTDAVEGQGIAYWAIVKDVKRDKDGYVTSFKVTQLTRSSWIVINAKKINEAALAMLTGRIEVSREIASQFIGIEWETDQHGVDAVVQASLFNCMYYS